MRAGARIGQNGTFFPITQCFFPFSPVPFFLFSFSPYEQNYSLPDDVVRDKISAKVEDGILTITMPKTEPKEKVTKAIEVS